MVRGSGACPVDARAGLRFYGLLLTVNAMMRLFMILTCLVLAACGTRDDGFVAPTGDQLANLKMTVAAVDWSTAQKRTLVLDQFDFAPAKLTFKRGQPYEMTVTNKGFVAHDFVAPAFFDAVAIKALIFSDGEVRMPLLEYVTFGAGETKILVFVPERAGEFPLVCDQPLHERFGMEGRIRIE